MEVLDLVAGRLREAARLTVLTGAGVSAPSGVPTFRGADGLWRRHRPEDLATPAAFARDPRLVWEWYDWRRTRIVGCQPNAAHRVLAAWSQRLPQFTLITQNVDGLHERAGTRGVVRFHGTLWELRCARRCSTSPPAWADDRVPLPELPPRCPWCGGLARPNVVWFGEPIEPRALDAAVSAADCDVFLAIGTSAVVQPAASLLAAAHASGAFTVEINLEGTPATALSDAVLRGSADEVLLELDRRLA
ncbi:MAG TPA: NAD-dependent deacylase [Vicinamibacterales bacterium]|nr:NAD-dependent deacylase [Vicinamibacterales bacterium]